MNYTKRWHRNLRHVPFVFPLHLQGPDDDMFSALVMIRGCLLVGLPRPGSPLVRLWKTRKTHSLWRHVILKRKKSSSRVALVFKTWPFLVFFQRGIGGLGLCGTNRPCLELPNSGFHNSEHFFVCLAPICLSSHFGSFAAGLMA